jgi:hypothetical protein
VPSVKLIVPEGAPAVEVSVAVNVTGPLNRFADGLAAMVRAVVALPEVITTTGEVEVAFTESPA